MLVRRWRRAVSHAEGAVEVALVIEAPVRRHLGHRHPLGGPRRAGALQPQPHQPRVRRQASRMRETPQELEAAQSA
ncbi:hypothetical protein G6F31_017504 [Rhizopus arrhizus]|nr:hypothetical protein G6F31_017504 [Rhizopus arrhizus]